MHPSTLISPALSAVLGVALSTVGTALYLWGSGEAGPCRIGRAGWSGASSRWSPPFPVYFCLGNAAMAVLIGWRRVAVVDTRTALLETREGNVTAVR